jgi:hypothetical protein
MNPFINAKLVGADIDADEYHKQDAKRGDQRYVMSRSALVNFASNPDRWLKGYKEEDEGTTATEWGTLIDLLVTCPKRFDDKFAIKPETYRNEKGETKPWSGNANVCKAWAEEQSGRIIIKADEKRDADYAITRLHQDSDIHGFIACSQCQVMATADYQDRLTGVIVPVKILVDFVPDKHHPAFGQDLGDLKTARNASPGKWSREVFDRRYHWQSAMNLDVYAAATGEDRTGFRHIVSENVHPYQPGKRWLDQEMIQLGRAEYLRALGMYAECLKTNYWPSWDDSAIIKGWTQVSMEAWMVKP